MTAAPGPVGGESGRVHWCYPSCDGPCHRLCKPRADDTNTARPAPVGEATSNPELPELEVAPDAPSPAPIGEEDGLAAGLGEFIQWVATNRAYNGSGHKYGQALYNECLNGVLGQWVEEWLAARRAERVAEAIEEACEHPWVDPESGIQRWLGGYCAQCAGYAAIARGAKP